MVYKLKTSANLEASIVSALCGESASLKQNTKIVGQIQEIGMCSYDGVNVISSVMIPVTKAQLDFESKLNVGEDNQSTTISTHVDPIDMMIGYKDIEQLLRYSAKLQEVLLTYQPKKTISSAKPVIIEEKPTEPLVKNIKMNLDAKAEQIRIMIIDDYNKNPYPLAKIILASAKGKVVQNTIIPEGTNQEIDASVDEISCELGKALDSNDPNFDQYTKNKYLPLV